MRETEEFRRRHARYFLELAETGEPELWGRQQLAWLERLDAELDNLRAALLYTIEREPEAALRVASALTRFWWTRGRVDEGFSGLEQALQTTETVPASIQAKALNGAAVVSWFGGHFDRASPLATESLALYRGLGDDWGCAEVLAQLGILAGDAGDEGQGDRLIGEKT